MTEEAQEQEALIERAQYHPITREYLFKIHNEGKRHPLAGHKLKLQGLKAGVSDLFLSYPAGGYHGLYIEMKRRDKNAKATKEQLQWIEKVSKVGYAASIAHGWEEAWEIINDYLKPKKTMTISFKVEHNMQIKSAEYSNTQWDITMTGAGWPWMMKLAHSIRCKKCGSEKVRKDGAYMKGGHIMECLNCRKYFIAK